MPDAPHRPKLTDAEQDSKDFVKNVWKVVGGIPEGHVLTYGEVARLSGRPHGARRVSQAMRLAPRPDAPPCGANRVLAPNAHCHP